MNKEWERIEEKQLLLPALYVIDKYGSATTSKLIEELTMLFQPSGEDAEILAGRNDTKFSQKVRNLMGSHWRTNEMIRYTKRSGSSFSLSKQGELKLARNRENLDVLFSGKYRYPDMISAVNTLEDTSSGLNVIYNEDVLITEGKTVDIMTRNRVRSTELREYAIDYYKRLDGGLNCKVCGFDFESHYGEYGKDYIEMHHEKPICMYDNEGNSAPLSEAVLNIKPLCANCHRIIHRDRKRQLSVEELMEIYIQ